MTSDRIRSPQRLAAVARTRLLDTPPEGEFDRLTELARTLLSAPFAFVTVVDDRRSLWKSCLGVELAPGVPPQNTVEESFCQYVVDSGEPLILPDVREVALTRDNPSMESMGVVAWAGFPVHTPDGEVLGTLCVADTEVREWSETDVAMLASLAAVASDQVALRVAVVDAERQRRRAELLDRSATLLTAGLEFGAVLDAVSELALSALGDHVAVHTVQPDGVLRLAAARSSNGSRRPASRRPPARLSTDDRSGPGRVAATGRSELVADVPRALTTLDEPMRRTAEGLGAVSSVCVPLRAPGAGVLGVLTVVRTGDSPPHDAGDVELAEVIAGRAALVLDNARRFGQERDFSLRLQEALLTPPPRPDRLHLTVRYSPAEHRAAVGGDWYDAFVLPDGATVLVIGDVTGHDTTAAVAMSQLRGVIRTIAYDSDATPAEVLARSDIAAHGLDVATTATALVARIGPADADGRRELRWSNAGHPVPALLDIDGQVRLLDTKPNRMLGVDPAVQRDGHTAFLAVGQTLLLCTDGLIERRGADYDDGVAALVQALAGLQDLPLDDLAETLLRRLKPAVADDDIALIAVRPFAG